MATIRRVPGPGAILRESAIAELGNRHHRRFVGRAGRYRYAVPDISLSVNETTVRLPFGSPAQSRQNLAF